MRKLIAFGGTFLALILVAVLNPSPDAHEREIAETYANQNPITGAVGVGEALGAVALYHDYVFFSTTSLGDARMSVGGVGIVHATPPPSSEFSTLVREELAPKVKRKVLKRLPEWMREEFETSN